MRRCFRSAKPQLARLVHAGFSLEERIKLAQVSSVGRSIDISAGLTDVVVYVGLTAPTIQDSTSSGEILSLPQQEKETRTSAIAAASGAVRLIVDANTPAQGFGGYGMPRKLSNGLISLQRI